MNQTNALVANPFGANQSAESSGSRQLQARENAETMSMVAMAKRFPRDVIANSDKILNAFTRVTLAEKAQYQFAKGGSDVSGPSIRAAEAIAQMWGNLSTGFKEISRGVGHDGVTFSEVEAFCWDMETNTRQPLQFIVRHWRDTKRGGYQLSDERDIYELIANQAQRRKRACILALVPGDVVEAAMAQSEMTLRTKADTSPEAMAKMVDAFAPFSVTKEHIEKRIQRRLDAIQPAQVVMLKRIYASLRDDMSKAADWFEVDGDAMQSVAERPAPAAEKEKQFYPADLFEKAFPGWENLISEGKKTKAQAITALQSKFPLTEEQKARINKVALPAQEGTAEKESKKTESSAHAIAAADVERHLRTAKNLDDLDAAADLIGAVEDPGLRAGLSEIYTLRQGDLA